MPQQKNYPRSAFMLREGQAVQLQVADGDGKGPRRFSMTAYSGGIIKHPLWGQLAIDLAGVEIARSDMPCLRDHDAGQIVGWTEKVEKGGRVAVEGVFSGQTQAAKDVMALADEGFPWQASIYIPATEIEFVDRGMQAEVNGQKLSGPGAVFRKSRLREVSFCAVGADPHTSAAALSDAVQVEIVNHPIVAPQETGMELKDLTLAQLKADRADLVTAVRSEADADFKNAAGKQASDAVAAERERALKMLKLGDDFKNAALCREAIEKGDSEQAALVKFQAAKLTALQAGTPGSPGANPDTQTAALDPGKPADHMKLAEAYRAEHKCSLRESLRSTAAKRK